MRALLVALSILAARDAHGQDRELGGRDLCARGARHHGAPIDLDVKDADIRDVFRLISDAGRVNLVVSDDVSGKLTLRLRHVAWDAVACAVAAVHHLTITVHDNILLVTPAARQGLSLFAASSETKRFEADRGAPPKRSEARGGPTKRARLGGTTRGARNATVAAGDANRDSP